MSFNDDDEIKNIVTGDISKDENAETFPEGKTQATVINNPEAPLTETNFNVMFELTGAGSGKDRPGLDLVTVLDVSGSMGKDKLDKVKISMEFVINKLSSIDRLSVVKFSNNAERVCRLRQITKESQAEVKALVNALDSDGGTNIASGLETALEVLSARRFSTGRTVAIMLMSDGGENIRKAAEEVNFSNVPVFTFGFGINHEPRVLTEIAIKSGTGTFSDAQKQDDLSLAFAQCLGGLLTVVVEHLEVTVKSIKSTLIKVSAGNYKQVSNGTSVTITFGNLYIKEVRKIIVELRLPLVTTRLSADILEISYKYKSPEDRNVFDAAPIFVRVRRNGIVVMPERPEMTVEQSRIKTSQMMKEARILADQKRLDEARRKLAEAQNLLEDIVADQPIPMIEMMKYEISELLDLMQSEEVYERQGRPFALSSETSHERQRYAARGDVSFLRLFSTPRMDKYLEQVQVFEEDPTKPLPTEEEDVKEELEADPLSGIASALSYHIQNAIKSLEALDKILRKPLNA